MNRPPFHVWAPQEIARLRAEAENLQRVLDAYLGTPTAKSDGGVRNPAEPRRARGSKYESLFAAFETAARPLSIDDMIGIADTMGINMTRANMRSQVFAQKVAGRAIPEGDKYFWRLSKMETAPAGEEGAV